MSALQRNCERRKLDPLNEELIRMTREIQVGTPRRVALRNMSERVRQPDLRSVVHALVQADELEETARGEGGFGSTGRK